MVDNEPHTNKFSITNDEIAAKVDLVLERQDCTQRALARLRADLLDTIREAIKAVLKERTAKRYFA